MALHVPPASLVAPVPDERAEPALERSLERLVDRAHVDKLDLGTHLGGQVGVDVALVRQGKDGARNAGAVSGKDLRAVEPCGSEGRDGSVRCSKACTDRASERRTFSLMPPTGVTRPRSVTSPVMAVCARGGMPRTAREQSREREVSSLFAGDPASRARAGRERT